MVTSRGETFKHLDFCKSVGNTLGSVGVPDLRGALGAGWACLKGRGMVLSMSGHPGLGRPHTGQLLFSVRGMWSLQEGISALALGMYLLSSLPHLSPSDRYSAL